MLNNAEVVDKFMQVRVKSIKYLEMDAVAIYFYDVTYQIEQLKSEDEVKGQKHRVRANKAANSHHFLTKDLRDVVSISLMLLQNLLDSFNLAE